MFQRSVQRAETRVRELEEKLTKMHEMNEQHLRNVIEAEKERDAALSSKLEAESKARSSEEDKKEAETALEEALKAKRELQKQVRRWRM